MQGQHQFLSKYKGPQIPTCALSYTNTDKFAENEETTVTFHELEIKLVFHNSAFDLFHSPSLESNQNVSVCQKH